MKNVTLASLLAPLKSTGRYLVSHQKIVYFIASASVIIVSFISLNLALYQPTDVEYRLRKESEAQSSRFDEDTIEKIQNLNASQQTRTDNIPTRSRTNPFSE